MVAGVTAVPRIRWNISKFCVVHNSVPLTVLNNQRLVDDATLDNDVGGSDDE
jgi:hypothetical protein